MARPSSAIAAAELRVAQSRLELRVSLSRLRRRLTSPPVLASAAILGTFLAFSLARRGSTGVLAGAVALQLLRRLYVR